AERQSAEEREKEERTWPLRIVIKKERGAGSHRRLSRTVYVWLLTAIRGAELICARRLSCRELVHAEVVGVVHEVLDRIVAGVARAGILDRAAERGALLGRRVIDVIALAVTAALERVVQADPVADLVRGRVAFVVRRGRAAR